MDKTSAEKFAEIVAWGAKEYGVKFRTKRTWAPFWRFINKVRNVLFFNPPHDFVDSIITTLGPYIFFHAPFDPAQATDRDVLIYVHELEHVKQYKMCGLGSAWLGIIPFLILYFFIPVPVFFAWFRYHFERKAFQAEAHYAYKYHLDAVINIPDIADDLTGKLYFFSWYSRRQVYNWLCKNLIPGREFPSKPRQPS